MMDQVLARLKRLRKNPYRKLISDRSLFQNIDVSAVSFVNYSPDHNLDEDAWFVIDDFSSRGFFPSELGGGIDTKDYDDLSKDKFAEISCLLGLQGENIYFQKVTPSSFIKRKTITFGEVAFVEENSNRIVVKQEPDAVFLRSSNRLIFKDIASISSIFKGIDQLYKEATEAEVKAFLESDFISISGSYDHSAVSKPNRKRLALVTDTMKSMSASQRANLVDYIKGYCEDGVTITNDGKRFELSTDNQLKLILYGIEERFYTTQHSREKRLANSVEALN